MTDLDAIKHEAWLELVRTARTAQVITQIGYLIDHASGLRGVLHALAMIGEFETEEEFAAQEALLNSRWEM